MPDTQEKEVITSDKVLFEDTSATKRKLRTRSDSLGDKPQRVVRVNSFSGGVTGSYPSHIQTTAAILDAEALAYVGLKYFIDLFATTKGSANPLRDFLLTPTGIVITSVESAALIGLSLIANTTDKDDDRAYRQAIKDVWPYIRNVIGEVKNANKSVKNTLKLTALLYHVNLNYMMMPAGLLVGLTSALNRVWFRRLLDERKILDNDLKALIKNVPTSSSTESDEQYLTSLIDYRQELQEYYEQIPALNSRQRYAYLSAVYSGMMDSLTFYIAPLTLMAFSSPAFIPIASVCIVFSAANLTARLYEEYEYQRGFELATLGVRLRLKQQDIALFKNQLELLVNQGVLSSQDRDDHFAAMLTEVEALSKEFNAKSAGMINHALAGLKNGIAVYAVASKVLFSSLLFLNHVPTALLVSNAVIGLTLLAGFTIYSLWKAHNKQLATEANTVEESQALEDIYSKANHLLAGLIQAHTIATTPRASSSYNYTQWLDVVRAFFSGLNKGQKLIGYLLTISFLEASLHSDFQDSPIVIQVTSALGVFCSIVLSLRAYSFHFGDKATPEKINPEDSPEEIEFYDSVVEENTQEAEAEDRIAAMVAAGNSSAGDIEMISLQKNLVEEYNPHVDKLGAELPKETQSQTGEKAAAHKASVFSSLRFFLAHPFTHGVHHETAENVVPPLELK